MLQAMRRERTLIANVCMATLLVACIGPTEKPQRIAASSPALDTQFVLEESYWATMGGVVVHLPYGVYSAALEDKRGLYYKAPFPIKRKWLFFGSEKLVDGGIYVPNSSTEKRVTGLWVYIVRDDGSFETHLLPGEINAAEGSLWRIEPREESTNYDVHAECLGTVPHGSYELVLPGGTTQVVGAFADGHRDGVFTFYRSSGETFAEVPYVNDRVSGTVQLWYGPEYGSGRKLITRYFEGQLNGRTKGWYPDGTVRERSTYVDGALDATEIYDENGDRVSDRAARARAESARDADRWFFSVLDEVVETNSPSCPAR